MKRLIKRFFLTVLPLLILNCYGMYGMYGTDVTMDYFVPLASIEKPMPGRYIIEQVGHNGYSTYTDSLIDALFSFNKDNISFTIQNKTNDVIKLIWDDAVMIDVDKTSNRVMHTGIKYSERSNSMPPSIIPKNGRIEDMVIPVSRITWINSDWYVECIFPCSRRVDNDNSKKNFIDKCMSNLGSKIGLLLPLEINGVENIYTFWFVVKNVMPANY